LEIDADSWFGRLSFGGNARSLAVGLSQGAEAGLVALRRLPPDVAARFQPALATQAHLLEPAGRTADAGIAYAAAIRETTDPP
jgi:predicted RNA polymerase sigma factor